MIATHNQQAPNNNRSLNFITEEQSMPIASYDKATFINPAKDLKTTLHFLPSRLLTHPPQAGLNPLVDSAGYLFSIIGKLKQIKFYRQLSHLQKELIQEINRILEASKHQGYNAEYIIVCRYILCATLDDVIANTPWGNQGQWDSYSLLAAFNQDLQHHDKLFNIMERAINDPATYIDLMELMYICLSLGYKGQYRATEYSQYQLEQITNSLYKHICAYRGRFTKVLSPSPLKTPKPIKQTPFRSSQLIFIGITTVCIIMSIFVSLGYLTDMISNEVYKTIAQIEASSTYRA